MSKAILVIDTPKNVEECSAKLVRMFGCILFSEGRCKRNDCPLKPLPQHKITDLEKTTDYSCGWEKGYNVCLDEILGEEE